VRPSPARQADLTLLFATLIWGASFVVVKDALASSTPLAFTAVRFAIAAVVLTPFARLGARFTRAELRAGVLLGTLLAGGFATQAVGLVYTTASRSAFIVSTSSLVAPVVAFVALRERPRPTVIAALGLAALGMYLLTAPGAGGLNRGDLWTLGTAVCFGAQIAAVAELSRRYDSVRLVWMEIVATAAGATLAALAFEDVRLRASPALALALGYSGVLATALALLWQTLAQRQMSAARAALVFCLEPVFAAGVAWLWLGERMSGSQWLGGGLILAGMVAAELPRRGDPPPR
jgi:drug/metabolite transporter (DMT)-like permease